jgi:hypothetical protein
VAGAPATGKPQYLPKGSGFALCRDKGQSLTPCFGSDLLFWKFQRKAAIKALARGQSLDQFVAQAIADG